MTSPGHIQSEPEPLRTRIAHAVQSSGIESHRWVAPTRNGSTRILLGWTRRYCVAGILVCVAAGWMHVVARNVISLPWLWIAVVFDVASIVVLVRMAVRWPTFIHVRPDGLTFRRGLAVYRVPWAAIEGWSRHQRTDMIWIPRSNTNLRLNWRRIQAPTVRVALRSCTLQFEFRSSKPADQLVAALTAQGSVIDSGRSRSHTWDLCPSVLNPVQGFLVAFALFGWIAAFGGGVRAVAERPTESSTVIERLAAATQSGEISDPISLARLDGPPVILSQPCRNTSPFLRVQAGSSQLLLTVEVSQLSTWPRVERWRQFDADATRSLDNDGFDIYLFDNGRDVFRTNEFGLKVPAGSAEVRYEVVVATTCMTSDEGDRDDLVAQMSVVARQVIARA
jgi:hypothetical protein